MIFFLIASGPSLSEDQIERIKYFRFWYPDKARVLVISDNYRRAPWADYLYSCDKKWFDYWIPRGLKKDFAGEIWAGNQPAGEAHKINFIEVLRKPGLSKIPKFIYAGSNSGYQAINLAYHWGAKKIVLVGYDMQETGGQKHWFGEHPDVAGMRCGPNFGLFLKSFPQLASDLEAEGVKVYNCTISTALSDFEKRDLEELLCEL